MELDFFIVLACCVLGMVAHGCRHQSWLTWIVRVIIGICLFGEVVSASLARTEEGSTGWGLAVLWAVAALTMLLLFRPCRGWFSQLFTAVDAVFSGRLILAAVKRTGLIAAYRAERIFVPESVPHMVALWIFISSVAFLLGNIEPSAMQMPAMPIPMPVPLGQLLSYNGLGLVLLSFCGIGIYIARKPLEAMARLGWRKPTWTQVGVGVSLIFVTFLYDYLWSLSTHGMEGNLASKLAGYNAGTFTAGGGAGGAGSGAAGPALILALFTGLCAGIGEETLIRGACQPVFGIFPAAMLHGLLHGQFSHAPIFILQVAGWSTIMGIVRRYTNTTTTIIGHAGFNFITTFLFAFNP